LKKQNKLLAKFKREAQQKLKLGQILLTNIKKHRKEINFLLDKVINHREGEYEGKIYRFYHYSFKVYNLHLTIGQIVAILQKLDPKPKPEFCLFFQTILDDALAIGEWKAEHNRNWLKYTRPIVEAFLHAKYMLEMASLCDKLYKRNPTSLIDQKWGSLLELYEIR